MESSSLSIDFGKVVHVVQGSLTPEVIVVCEHASNRVPSDLDALGLSEDALRSHIAWDPGAIEVAEAFATKFSTVLVSGGVSRLVYDCNRPPEAASAMPAKSEVFAIPGNASLSVAEKADRVAAVYEPFQSTLADTIETHRETLRLLVTIHSFSPVFKGASRDVEIGILHGKDDRFALAMMETRLPDVGHVVRLNEPYSAKDGVAHTLDLHGHPNTLLSVMIEIRNDLISSAAGQAQVAETLARWVKSAWSSLEISD